jgi:hypothetical protein
MRLRALVFAGAVAIASVSASPEHMTPTADRAEDPTRVVQSLQAARALSFEANAGQTDPSVRFLSRGQGYSIFLTRDAAVLSLTAPRSVRMRQGLGTLPTTLDASGAVVRMGLAGAQAPRVIEGETRLPGVSHYFKGNDPAKWLTNVATYEKVRYVEPYAGIDVVYYGNQRQLEYDFVVAPGADPSAIRLTFEGADHLSVDRNGDLIVSIAERRVLQRKPRAYQEVGSDRREIASAYAINARGEVTVSLGDYDRDRKLTIDPVLFYSTYLGGSETENVGLYFGSIAVDRAGNAYVAGITASADFPGNARPFGGGLDGFVVKLDQFGSVVYSAVLGGRGADDIRSVAVDPAGSLYMTGTTQSPDFPTTAGTPPTTCTVAGDECVGRGFVTKVSPSGRLVYSALLGGADPVTGYGTAGEGIAVDPHGNAMVVGGTGEGLRPTPGAFQTVVHGRFDGFLAKLNGTGTALTYVTYYGGRLDETHERIALDRQGGVYITGGTRSEDFPTTEGAFQRTCPPTAVVPEGGCGWIAFVMKFTQTGALAYSTYLGGSNTTGAALQGTSSDGNDIAVDQQGSAFVVGTSYTNDFPTTAGSLMPETPGAWNAFVAKFSPDGRALLYSTYLGGSADDYGVGIALDRAGQAYVTGGTASRDLPTLAAAQSVHGGGLWDAFVAKLNGAGDALVYATYVGGADDEWGDRMAIDRAGTAYVTGFTESTNFPTVQAAQPVLGGGTDAFAVKLGDPTCGVEVTQQVDVLRFPSAPFLGLQLVFVHNGTTSAIEGPIGFVLDDLRNGTLVNLAPKTDCFATPSSPFVVLADGPDGVLSPHETTGTLLLFSQTRGSTIAYVPRVTSGLPTQ